MFSISIVHFSGCHLEVLDNIKDGLIASFSYESSNSSLKAPVVIEFFNESLEASSYEWNFGDNSSISNEANPVHLYSKPGEYNVSLIAMNDEVLTD